MLQTAPDVQALKLLWDRQGGHHVGNKEYGSWNQKYIQSAACCRLPASEGLEGKTQVGIDWVSPPMAINLCGFQATTLCSSSLVLLRSGNGSCMEDKAFAWYLCCDSLVITNHVLLVLFKCYTHNYGTVLWMHLVALLSSRFAPRWWCPCVRMVSMTCLNLRNGTLMHFQKNASGYGEWDLAPLGFFLCMEGRTSAHTATSFSGEPCFRVVFHQFGLSVLTVRVSAGSRNNHRPMAKMWRVHIWKGNKNRFKVHWDTPLLSDSSGRR